MAETFRWTVDVETDYGGRSEETRGIDDGLPKIIRAFKERGIKALFFISGELLVRYPRLPQEIRSQGHEVGSHGYFHTVFRERFRAEENRNLAATLFKEEVPYRAPKFSHQTEDRYSQKKGHVSVLRHMWTWDRIDLSSIIYLHPFDLISTKENAPNVFCKLWYSRPDKAYRTFLRLLDEDMSNKRS